MPINPAALVGTTLPQRRHRWDEDDVILYALGVGAGVPATDPRELGYVYERGLQVLPGFGVLAPTQALFDVLEVDAFDVQLSQILHAEHDLRLSRALPTRAEVIVTARVGAVHDTGRHAIVALDMVTRLADSGEELCTNRMSLHVRGEGGFGGERGPAAPAPAPQRAPDHVVDCPILEQQALLYRLSGDRNPLHADPEFAASAGLDRPILHGLCTYGMAYKAAIDALGAGRVDRFTGLRARFTGVVFPGETLRIALWEVDDTVAVAATVPAREHAAVLSGVLTVAT